MSGSLIPVLGNLFKRWIPYKKGDINDKMALAKSIISIQEQVRKQHAQSPFTDLNQSLVQITKDLNQLMDTTIENKNLIERTLREADHVGLAFQPFRLDSYGFTGAIREKLIHLNRSTDLIISADIESVDGLLTSEKKRVNILSAIIEALNNAVRHAQATTLAFSMKSDRYDLIVDIQDDGIGFDHELTIVRTASRGLQSMHQLIASIGGTVKIQDNVSRGTSIKMVIPHVTPKTF